MLCLAYAPLPRSLHSALHRCIYLRCVLVPLFYSLCHSRESSSLLKEASARALIDNNARCTIV